MANNLVNSLKRIFSWSSAQAPRNRQLVTRDVFGHGTHQSAALASQHTIESPTDRIMLYDIYEELDDTVPEIASVLDQYSEDATQVDKVKGKSVWIESDNEEIQTELTSMLERLGIEEDLEGLFRDLAKYGDDFMRLIYWDPATHPELARKTGIHYYEFVDPRVYERVEDEYGVLIGFVPTDLSGSSTILDDRILKPWDVVHFRIRTRKYTPMLGRNIHGTSMLKNSIRPGRQKRMLDDLMLNYRLHKSTDKRIYYIDVGNAAPEQIPSILNLYRNNVTRKSHLNRMTSEAFMQRKPMSFLEDIFWPIKGDSQTRIDSISADPNIRDIVDIEHKVRQLFGTLRAPMSSFGFSRENQLEARNPASSVDIRFARAVMKLQKSGIQGLTRMCQIHLALRGMDPSADNFRVCMTEPSALEHLMRIENMQQKLGAADQMIRLGQDIGLDNKNWAVYVMRMIFGFNNKEIEKYYGDTPLEEISPDELNKITTKLLLEKLGPAEERRYTQRVQDTSKREQLPTCDQVPTKGRVYIQENTYEYEPGEGLTKVQED